MDPQFSFILFALQYAPFHLQLMSLVHHATEPPASVRVEMPYFKAGSLDAYLLKFSEAGKALDWDTMLGLAIDAAQVRRSRLQSEPTCNCVQLWVAGPAIPPFQAASAGPRKFAYFKHACARAP